LYCGANPIFLGSDEYFNLCEEDFLNFLEECTEFKNNITYNKLTKKRIKALIVVHVWGNACKLDKILEKCRARNIKIVEDAAESLGTFYEQGFLKGKHTGTIGDVGCISFNGNKIITTGGGGAVLSQSEKVARKIKYLSTQAKDDSFHYIHNEIGYNYRLSNVNAAIGLAQIENIDKILTKKKEINSWYKDIFQRNNFLQIYDPPTYSKNNHWLNILKIDKEERLKKLKKLNDNNINARPVWKLFTEQEYLKNYECHGLMKSKKLVEESICLPSSYSLEVEDVRKIFEILKD
jgi:dTDP-4-amino-4,6-dideoxygalactose transaminase